MNSSEEVIRNSTGIVSASELNKAEYMRIRRAAAKGDVERLKHGIYAEPTALLNTMIDIDRLVPRGVVCLYNAWAFYGLSTIVPPGFSVAISSKRKIKLPEALPISLCYWKKENFDFGIVEQNISGINVLITDLERSVCDAVKYRNKIGLDTCIEVVKNYLLRPDKNISRLLAYAKRLRVSKTLASYIEILI